MKREIRNCFVASLVLLLLPSLKVVRLPHQIARASSPPVVAYYFNYWGAPFGGTIPRSFESWNFPLKNGQPTDPNTIQGPEPWRRQITAGDGTTYPLIGPYDSSNKDVVRWQVQNAKNAGIDAFTIFLFGAEFNKTTKDTDDTYQRSRMWWTTGHVTVPVIEETTHQPFKFLIGQDDFGFNESDPHNSSTCDYATTSCGGHALSDFPQNVASYIQSKNLTQARYADAVLNAYSALSKWKKSQSYFLVDNKPAYFFGPVEPYRDNPAKFNQCLRGVEELLGLPDHGIYWFGYDGVVTWGTDDAAPNIWNGILDGLDDGWGVSKGMIYSDNGNYTNTRANVSALGKRITEHGLDWIPTIQTSFDDTSIRTRGSGDVLNAATHTWLKRNNGETFKKSILSNKDAPYPKKFYFLSSWNATPLEGYSVEPAVSFGDDDNSDPYKYLKILATNLTGASFSPASLPPRSAIDPLRADALGLTAAPAKIGDINNDGTVSTADLKLLTSSLGATGTGNPSDLNGDGKVDIFDFTILVSQFVSTR